MTRKTRHGKKKIDDDMSGNCGMIFIFLIYGQSGAIPTPDYGCIVCNTYTLINSNVELLKKRVTSLKLRGSWY